MIGAKMINDLDFPKDFDGLMEGVDKKRKETGKLKPDETITLNLFYKKLTCLKEAYDEEEAYDENSIFVTSFINVFGGKVNNVHRYTVGWDKENFSIKSFLSGTGSRILNLKDKIDDLSFSCSSKIVFILESPHIKEFDSNMNPINPANGATGTRILFNLYSLLTKLKEIKGFKISDCYDVCILNPVPYQASRGVNTTSVRNIVWEFLWNHHPDDLKDKFRKFIESAPSGSIILNCCTSKDKGKLKKAVASELTDCKVENIWIGELDHPSSPTFKGSIDKLPKNLREYP